MVEVSLAAPSRQLNDILLNTFSELVCSGDLDDTITGAISDVLQFRTLDGIILDTIPQLAKKVIMGMDFVTLCYIQNRKYSHLRHSNQREP